MTTIEARREQTRARYPDRDGYVERDGVRIFYEVYGTGEPTVLLLPTWSIIHSRHWKAQIPYLARHARVVTFDGRGNGRSDRPGSVEAYAEREFAADALAVHGRHGHRARRSRSGCRRACSGACCSPPSTRSGSTGPCSSRRPRRSPSTSRASTTPFDEPLETYDGWAKYNRHYWLENYRDFLEFFFSQMLHGAALDQAARGRRRLGARNHARDPGADLPGPGAERR